MMKHQLRLLLVVLSGFLLLGTTALAQDFHGCPIEGKDGDPALNPNPKITQAAKR